MAEQLCITERHVRRLVAERRIPYVKVGRFVRFDPADVADWIIAARIPARGLSYPVSMVDVDRIAYRAGLPVPDRAAEAPRYVDRHGSRKMTRRRTFGSIRKLSSGRYQARYTSPDGVRHRAPRSFATKAEASRWLASSENDLARGTWTDPDAARVVLTSTRSDGYALARTCGRGRSICTRACSSATSSPRSDVTRSAHSRRRPSDAGMRISFATAVVVR